MFNDGSGVVWVEDSIRIGFASIHCLASILEQRRFQVRHDSAALHGNPYVLLRAVNSGPIIQSFPNLLKCNLMRRESGHIAKF